MDQEDEQKLSDLAPLMRDTILAWEASINATTREETERLYIKAARLRNSVVAMLACKEPDWNERMSQGFDIGKARPDHPIKGQDGSPNDKTEIVSGIMDGFAQPLPNLDHIIIRRVPPPFMTAGQMDAFLANAIQAPSIDDDLNNEPLGPACSIDNPGCDSCQ